MPNNADAVVASAFSRATDHVEDAWNLVEDYINGTDYNAATGWFIDDVDILFDPALDRTEFTVGTPVAPSFPDPPEISGNFEMPDLPSSPEITLPTPPTLSEYTIPGYTSPITVPVFSETLPSIDLTPVSEVDVRTMFSFLTEGYAPQISSIKDILFDRIVNGGTGIPAEVEQDIWDRNLERDQQALQDGIDVLAAQWGKLGWSLPDGMFAYSVAQLNNEFNNKRLDTSREIAIKQAELEQANINEALKLTAAIEEAYNTVCIGYINAASSAMKTSAEVAVALYNTTVQYYSILIEAYRAKAEVYKTLVEARAADVEVYRALIAAYQAGVDVDKAKIELYLAQIQAEDSKLKAYDSELKSIATRIDAMKTWLDVGRMRMDLFASQTRALTERYSGELEGFKAQLQAWMADGQNKINEKEVSLKAQMAEYDVKLKEIEYYIKNKEFHNSFELQKMQTLTEVGAHVIAGALAAAHASASIGNDYNENLTL